ncbi:MAG: EamA family transporter [Flavobacteriaceae bacterium]|nr:EamA family transporter [Flavobacteriaceae bacterium]
MFKTQLRLHFIVLLWGFTGIMGKLITLEALPLVFWRTLVAIASIFIVLKVLRISLKVTKKQLFTYFAVGSIIGLHWILFFSAIKVSNVSVALSTLSTGALFAAFIEPVFYKRKINPSEIILALIVISCLWLIFRASPEYLLGIILGILCAFLSALMTVLNGVLQKDSQNKPRVLMFYELVGAFILVLILLPFFGTFPQNIDVQPLDWLWLFILGSALTAFPMIESVALMKHISPYSLVLAVNLEPIYSIILAYFIFGESEKMSPLFYFAATAMILVVVLNQILKVRQKRKSLELKS